MRFLADMGVSMTVVHWLRSRGHDATHLREQDLQRLPDGRIFDKATAERRVVITFDLDFGEIATSAEGRRTSVIIFRLRNTRSSHVIDRLEAVLASSSGPLDAGAVVTVEEHRHRIRRLPVGEI
jgi:predicted nuclease of predicted toxin-antitoxin system